MVAAKMANMEQGNNQHAPIGATSQADAADKLGVGRRSVQRAADVLERGAQGLIAAVETGEIAVSDAALVADRPIADQEALLATVTGGEKKNLKAAARAADIAKQRAKIEAGNLTLPEGVFDCIVIDPPWPYDTAESYDGAGFRGGTPYPEESIHELGARTMPAADNTVLWLWTTHRFMHDAFHLLEAWGFEHKVILTWVKDRMGTGRWLRSRSEFCIMAVRGKPTVDLTNETTVLEAPMREHSRKPDEFYAMVEKLCVAERRLDYFSREKRPGWEQLGNDPTKFGDAALPTTTPRYAADFRIGAPRTCSISNTPALVTLWPQGIMRTASRSGSSS